MTRFEVFVYGNALVRSIDGCVRVAVVDFDADLPDWKAEDWARQIAVIFYETYRIERICCSSPAGNLNEFQVRRHCSVVGPER